MGLSPYPSPADAGMLCFILFNTVKSISIMKEIVQFVLHMVGIHILSYEEYPDENPVIVSRYCDSSSATSVEQFRSRIPAVLYGSVHNHKQLKHECSVCLTDFKPQAVINQLSCGHVFHKLCLEKWLKYWNVTCPNCRKHMFPHEEKNISPMQPNPQDERYLSDVNGSRLDAP